VKRSLETEKSDGGDNCSLSSGEVGELNDLLDRPDNGEEIDEDRLYELDLFNKRQSGEKLEDEEVADLEAFKQRRRGERLYRREFQALLAIVRLKISKASNSEDA
jgi:hypothetical protein